MRVRTTPKVSANHPLTSFWDHAARPLLTAVMASHPRTEAEALLTDPSYRHSQLDPLPPALAGALRAQALWLLHNQTPEERKKEADRIRHSYWRL